jgi:hypothetical protein
VGIILFQGLCRRVLQNGRGQPKFLFWVARKSEGVDLGLELFRRRSKARARAELRIMCLWIPRGLVSLRWGRGMTMVRNLLRELSPNAHHRVCVDKCVILCIVCGNVGSAVSVDNSFP